MSGGEPWYRDGLRFACTQCGNCCTGPPGAVWFDAQEGRAIATDLGVSHEEFLAKYTRAIGARRSLNEVETEHGCDCVFLDRTSTPGRALCRIYRSRPTQCRTWPFWHDNLTTRGAWEATKKRVPCPGMDAPGGRLHTLVEIRVMRDADARGSETTPW